MLVDKEVILNEREKGCVGGQRIVSEKDSTNMKSPIVRREKEERVCFVSMLMAEGILDTQREKGENVGTTENSFRNKIPKAEKE